MMSGIGPNVFSPVSARLARFGRVLVCIAAAAGPLSLPTASIADPLAPASGWPWRLAGVIIGPGLSEALFTHAGETRTVREGEQIDGWTVAAVRPHGVTLKGGGVEKILSPEGMSADEEALAASARAEEAAKVAAAAAVSAASVQQQREQQAAETSLAEATRQMKTH